MPSRPISRLNTAEERISKLEHRPGEITQTATQREKEKKKQTQNAERPVAAEHHQMD